MLPLLKARISQLVMLLYANMAVATDLQAALVVPMVHG
jgi:hypothetical protein